MTFYICRICGNLIEMVDDKKNTPSCCGKQMSRLEPASTDGAVERHEPVFICYCNCENAPSMDQVSIKVGTDAHPMTPEHYIHWIVLETDKGVYRRNLSPNEQPVVTFLIHHGEKIKCAYAYCNLHGLWQATKIPEKFTVVRCS